MLAKRWLEGNAFLTGENPSIADLFGYAYVEQDRDCGIILDWFKKT